LRFLGKFVISNLGHGSESRPSFLDGSFQPNKFSSISTDFLIERNQRNKKLTQYHQRYANVVIGAPYSTSYFAISPFINFFAMGLPIFELEIKFNNSLGSISEKQKKRIRILHSPSNPVVKGSSLILTVIDNLKNKGYEFDFVMIHGKSYDEVIREIQLCDFVVDQVFSDTPMAGFATEAACFGKPAVVGGYGLEELIRFIPANMYPPSSVCHPDHIEKAIEELLLDTEKRESLGRDAQSFVMERWNSVEVAKRYLRVIEGDIPDEWLLDPNNITYLYGGGQPIEITKQTIRELTSAYGVDALQLSHRPELEALFMNFANEEN